MLYGLAFIWSLVDAVKELKGAAAQDFQNASAACFLWHDSPLPKAIGNLTRAHLPQGSTR